jgi:hypothetical protein
VKVLIIPEDPTNDPYILTPVVERIFVDLGRKARVEVLRDPHLRGVDQALDRDTIAGIVQENPMVDLFLLLVDRDCNRRHNQERAQVRESEHPDRLLACLAIEESEVWMLALHPDGTSTSWKAIRAECDPKERYAEPFLKKLGSSGPGGGRKRAMDALAGNWPRLKQFCPEVDELQDRVARWLAARG